MPTLKYFPPQGGPREYSIHKAVTTVGRSLDNDVRVDVREVADHHAQIIFDGRDFNLEEGDRQAEILINGKKKRRGRLCHGDRLTLASARFSRRPSRSSYPTLWPIRRSARARAWSRSSCRA